MSALIEVLSYERLSPYGVICTESAAIAEEVLISTALASCGKAVVVGFFGSARRTSVGNPPDAYPYEEEEDCKASPVRV